MKYLFSLGAYDSPDIVNVNATDSNGDSSLIKVTARGKICAVWRTDVHCVQNFALSIDNIQNLMLQETQL